MLLTPVWTPLEDDGENQKSAPTMPQEQQRRSFGSPMVDITNRPAGVSPRPSPQKKPTDVCRRRTLSRTEAGTESSGILQEEHQRLPAIQPPQQIVSSGNSVSELALKDPADCCEITTLEVKPMQPSREAEAIAPSGTCESDPAVSRSTALRILKDRAQMRAQAKVDIDEKTPCATQIRDVLDVLLWACAILLVVALAVVFYQLTVHGHAKRVLFAVRVLMQFADSSTRHVRQIVSHSYATE
eukprot:COSAG02_NODE_2832_length_7927_cov_14.063202_5_plen_242_part_00